MAGRSGPGGPSGGGKTICPHCNTESFGDVDFCGNKTCRKPLKVFCPACGNRTKITDPNTLPSCPKCTADMVVVSVPSATGQSGNKSKSVKSDIEVTPGGSRGKYALLVQVTKNDVGVDKARVAIAGMNVGDHFQIVEGSDIAPPPPVPTPPAPVTPPLVPIVNTPMPKLVETNDKGAAVIKYEFSGQRRRLWFRVEGCMADTKVTLAGAPPEPDSTKGFWENFKKTWNHRRR